MKKSPTRTLGQPLAARAPGSLRKAVRDEQGRAAHDQQHAERHQERRNLETRHELAVDKADQGRRRQCHHEGDRKRGHAAVEQRPHQDGSEAEHRADRQVEFAGRHQQRHRQRDRAQFNRKGERVADVERRQEVVVQRPERKKLDDQEDEGAGFRHGDQAPDRRQAVPGLLVAQRHDIRMGCRVHSGGLFNREGVFPTGVRHREHRVACRRYLPDRVLS